MRPLPNMASGALDTDDIQKQADCATSFSCQIYLYVCQETDRRTDGRTDGRTDRHKTHRPGADCVRTTKASKQLSHVVTCLLFDDAAAVSVAICAA